MVAALNYFQLSQSNIYNFNEHRKRFTQNCFDIKLPLQSHYITHNFLIAFVEKLFLVEILLDEQFDVNKFEKFWEFG